MYKLKIKKKCCLREKHFIKKKLFKLLLNKKNRNKFSKKYFFLETTLVDFLTWRNDLVEIPNSLNKKDSSLEKMKLNEFHQNLNSNISIFKKQNILFKNIEEFFRPGFFFPHKKKFMQYWIFPFVGFVGLTWNKSASFPYLTSNPFYNLHSSIFFPKMSSNKNLTKIPFKKCEIDPFSYSFPNSLTQKKKNISVLEKNLYRYYFLSKTQLEKNLVDFDCLNSKNLETTLLKQNQSLEKLKKNFLHNEIFRANTLFERVAFSKSIHKNPHCFQLNLYSDFSKNLKYSFDYEKVFLDKFISKNFSPLKKQKSIFYEKSVKKMVPIPLSRKPTNLESRFLKNSNIIDSILENNKYMHFHPKSKSNSSLFSYSEVSNFSIEKSPLSSYEKAKNLLDYTTKILELEKPFVKNKSIKSIDFLEKLKIKENFIKRKKFSSKLLMSFESFKNQTNPIFNFSLSPENVLQFNSKNGHLDIALLQKIDKKVDPNFLNPIFLLSLTKKLKVDLDKFILLKKFWRKTNQSISQNSKRPSFYLKNSVLNPLNTNVISVVHTKKLKLFANNKQKKVFHLEKSSTLVEPVSEIRHFMDELSLLNSWKKSLRLSNETVNSFDLSKTKNTRINEIQYQNLSFLKEKDKFWYFATNQEKPLLLNETFLNKFVKTQNLLFKISSTKKNTRNSYLEKKNLEFDASKNFNNIGSNFSSPIEFMNPILLSGISLENIAKCSKMHLYSTNLFSPFSSSIDNLKNSYKNLSSWRANFVSIQPSVFYKNSSVQADHSFLIGSVVSSKEKNSKNSFQELENQKAFLNMFGNFKGSCLMNSKDFLNTFVFFLKNFSFNITKDMKTYSPFFVFPTTFDLKSKSTVFKKKQNFGNPLQMGKLMKKKKELKKQTWATSFEKREKNKKEKIFRTLFSYKSSLNYEINSSLDLKLKKFKLDTLIVQHLKKRVQLKTQQKKQFKKNEFYKQNFGNLNSFQMKKIQNQMDTSKKQFLRKNKKSFFKIQNKKEISLNSSFRRIGFLFLSEWNLKRNPFSYSRGDNVERLRFEKEKSLQKKRRRKKIKLETRRRKKRKRFYPRPIWLRYSLYKKFLTTRHPSFIKNSLLKTKQKKQRKGFKNKFSFSPHSISEENVFHKKFNKKQFNFKILFFKTNKLKHKIYRNNKQRWGSFLQDTPTYEKISLNKILTSTHLPVFQNKEYYKISPQILAEFQPLCWKSYWLRSNLTPYMNRVQKYFEKMKQIETSENVVFSFRSFLSSLFGFHMVDGLQKIQGKNFALYPSVDFKEKNFKQQVIEEKNISSFSTTLPFYSDLKNSFDHKGFSLSNEALFGETYYIAEYNRIQFERLSDILKKVKFNMNLEGKNKAKSYKFNAWKYLASKKELKGQNKKQFWYRFSKEIHPNFSSMSPFVLFSNLKGDTSLKPYGSNATLRMLWSFNKTNQFTFKEKTQIRELWEKTKQREQFKSNQTRNFFSKMFRPFSLSYFYDPLLLQTSTFQVTDLKKNTMNFQSQMKTPQATMKKMNVSTIQKFQTIQKKQNALTLYPQKTQPLFLLNSIFKNKTSFQFKNTFVKTSKKAKNQHFLLENYKPRFYDFYLRQLKFNLKVHSKRNFFVHSKRQQFVPSNQKRNFAKKTKFSLLKKEENFVQRTKLLKSSSVFWWSSRNFKTPLNLNSFNSFDFSKKEKNLFFHTSILRKDDVFSVNWMLTFSILFHLSLLFSFLRIPELRGALKFQGLIFYKITNNFFIVLYSIYELLKKYKKQWIKSFSIFLKLSSLILDPNPIDKQVAFSKKNPGEFVKKQFSYKSWISKPNQFFSLNFTKNSSFLENEFSKKSDFFETPNFYKKMGFKKAEKNSISFLNSIEFSSFKDLLFTSIHHPLSPTLLLMKKKQFFDSNLLDFNIISISNQNLQKENVQQLKQVHSKILEWNLNFPPIANKNWLVYSFLYNRSLRQNEMSSILQKSFHQTPFISVFQENFISSIIGENKSLKTKEKMYSFFEKFYSLQKNLRKDFSKIFFSMVTIQTKFALFFLFLTKSTVILGSNCIQLSYQLILKILDFFESILLIVYKFLEKPAELMIEWIAQIFLIEWTSDLSTFIPETFDTYFWDSFQKFFRNSRFFGLLEFQEATFVSNNFSPLFQSIPERTTGNSLSILGNFSFASLFSFQILNTLGFFMQRRLWSFYHFFLDSMLKSDLDLILRQKKGKIFWDIWAEILIKAADQYQINLPSLTSLKEEQEKFIERLIQDPSFFKKFGDFKEDRLPMKNLFLKDFHSIQILEAYKKKKFLFNKLKNKEQTLFSNNSLNLWNHSYKTKSWSSNQYVTFNLKDTDLFLDLSPPKSLFSVNFMNSYEPIQYTLGSIMCEIYSGRFSTQVSKNLLIVSSNLPSSNVGNTSSPSRTTYGNLLIQALAGESEMKMMIDNANRYATVERGVAVGMKLLKDVFDSIVLQTPCFFLIEEIHVIGERRPMLISDDENSKASQSVFGLEQGEESEKNQFIYQLSRHSINDFRRPYKGDFSRLIPTNLYMKDLYSFKKFRANSNSQKKYPMSMPMIEHQLKNEQSNEFNSFLSNTSLINSRLQILAEQFFVPPTTSPFTILMMKEQTKLKPKRIVKPMGWNSFLLDQMNSNKMDSIRVKVALLADITLRHFSVKLDMITDLLVIIDSVRSNRGFVVFATTHLPSILDPALRRPGRFDETISLPLLPHLMNRWKLFQMHLNENHFQKKFSKDTFDRLDYGLFTENYQSTQIFDFISKSKLSILNARSIPFSKRKKIFTKSLPLLPLSNSMVVGYNPISKKQKTFVNEVFSYSNFTLKKYPIKHPNQALQSSFVDKNVLENFALKSKKSMFLEKNFSQISFGYFQIGSLLIQMDLLKDQKTYSFYNKSLVLDKFSPLLFNALYSSNSEFKKLLFKFLGGKMSEFLATKNARSFLFHNSQENQVVMTTSEKNPFSILHQPIRYESWRFSTSWIFSIFQKRFLTNKNLIVTKMLSFDNPIQSSLREPPSPPASSLLMPTKKYENFKRVERDFQQKIGFSIHEKMQMHQKQRFLKKLYNQPVVETFKSQLFENRFTSFSSCFKEFSFFDSILLKTSSSHSYYKNRLSMRHRFSLINQWWNGQLAEHNVETTYLSEIDWRSMYIKTIQSSFDKTKTKNSKNLDLKNLLNTSLKENGKPQSIDSILDFPDADQHYNPRVRRWFLHANSWNYWLNFENSFYYDIYYHFLLEAFNQTSDYFEKNREFLDFMVSKFLQKGFLKEIDLIFLLARFYRK